MLALLRRLGRLLPGALGKLFGDRGSEERRHEKEMAELDAFRRGRLTPGYVARYAAVGVFVLAAVALLFEACFPDLIPGSPSEGLEHLVDLGVQMLQRVFGM